MVLAVVVLTLGGCAVAPLEQESERLDANTGTTVTVMPKPVELIVDRTTGPKTDPFAYVSDLGGYPDAGRGYGLSDLARAIGEGTPHRQSAELGFHVHEVMERVAEASASGATVRVVSRCERPAAVPQGAKPELS